jgi:uncharacterized protein (DUF362 family)
MKENDFTRREFLKVSAGAAAGLMTGSIMGCSGGGGGSEPGTTTSSYEAWSYQGQQMTMAVLETPNETLYRQLLPADFEMPDRLQVIVAVVSYHSVTQPLVPYHEGFVMLTCSYGGQDCVYTVTMPVDDQTACDAGIYLGFPKYVADRIDLIDSAGSWTGRVVDQGRMVMQISFVPSGSTETYQTSNPGLSCINRLSADRNQEIVIVNTTGTQWIQTTRGSATVIVDPAETWAPLLDGATLITAQADRISGNWTLTWANELKSSAVSIVKISDGRIDQAVSEAILLLGGMDALTAGKQKIMLKPNLVTEFQNATTNPEVVRTLTTLMQDAGKEVIIGEGSAWGTGYNLIGDVVYRTRDVTLLEQMQQYVFDTLGYTDLAQELDVPLVNLHTGDMATVAVPNGIVYDNLTLHRSLTEIDMLCSVPMMKTHSLGGVTLGMKNLIGLYPGTVYGTVRSLVHDQCVSQESSGVAAATVDMVHANKLGLVVIDGSMAMEGNGPTLGDLIQMDLIIAGTNPLATDMVTANIMGFLPEEIPTFQWANYAGMTPQGLPQIEIRGETIASVQRRFRRPQIATWNSIRDNFGAVEI